MIELQLNGEQLGVPAGIDLAALVAERVKRAGGVAVAVNDEVVPRSEWAATAVAAGDRIEILVAAQGG
jgi:sulfur carrier protein